MITKENCSYESLCQILESAFIDHAMDKDHITVKMGRVKIMVEVTGNAVRLLAFYGAKPGLTEQSLLVSLNAINASYNFPKVYLHNETVLVAELQMLIGGGLPARSLVEALRLMNDVLPAIPELMAIAD